MRLGRPRRIPRDAISKTPVRDRQACPAQGLLKAMERQSSGRQPPAGVCRAGLDLRVSRVLLRQQPLCATPLDELSSLPARGLEGTRGG